MDRERVPDGWLFDPSEQFTQRLWRDGNWTAEVRNPSARVIGDYHWSEPDRTYPPPSPDEQMVRGLFILQTQTAKSLAMTRVIVGIVVAFAILYLIGVVITAVVLSQDASGG